MSRKGYLDLSLYVITDQALARRRDLVWVVREAIRGGATAIQLREKGSPTREVYELGLQLRQITKESGVAFIINDRLDLALALDADGLHVGQDDLPAAQARRLLGENRVLGVSAESPEEAIRAEAEGADYIGAGPVCPTGTKPDAGEPIGIEGLRQIARAVRVPVVAIGGITLANAQEVISAGAAGIAVVSAVMAACDPWEASRHLRSLVEDARINMPSVTRGEGR